MVCLIWATPAIENYKHGRYGHLLDSPRACGNYFIAGTAIPALENCDIRTKARLTSWLIEQRRLGNSCPDITTATIDEAKLRRDMPISKRADSILQFIDSRTSHLGATVNFRFYVNMYDNTEPDDFDKVYFGLLSISESISHDELTFLMSYLDRQGLVKYSNWHNEIKVCELTMEGYTRLADLRETHTDSSRAFVAMWFDERMSEAWESGFRPAIVAMGFEPIRIDQTEHVNKIDDEIIAEIRRSRFVVADFTHGDDGARGGVYYEAGFAHGLGLPVLFTCRSDVFPDVHFDTRQYNHIVWNDPIDLRDRLSQRIGAVIGEGPSPNS